jgi:leader peptidase (prepilin peptidase) / N-methyltransferase
VLWFCASTMVAMLALALVVWLRPGVWWPALALHGAQALFGSLAGWMSLYLVGLIGTLAFRRNAMGFGDVKFLAPVGAFLGPVGVLYAFFAAALIGALVSLPLRLLGGSREIPFGPYLAAGSLLVLVGGPHFHQWLFGPLLRG